MNEQERLYSLSTVLFVNKKTAHGIARGIARGLTCGRICVLIQ